ncbi:MAG: hypothetical protein ACETWR_21400 [Anaerolineae bacterium]
MTEFCKPPPRPETAGPGRHGRSVPGRRDAAACPNCAESVRAYTRYCLEWLQDWYTRFPVIRGMIVTGRDIVNLPCHENSL